MASLGSIRAQAGQGPAKPSRRHAFRSPPFLVPLLALVVGAGATVVVVRALSGSSPPLNRVPAAAKASADSLAAAPDPAADPSGFAEFIGGQLDGFWRQAFRAMYPGGTPAYHPPVLDVFGVATSLPCFPLMDFNDGPPYFCFLDDTIYLPSQYVTDLAASTGPQARLAVAYVLAHEYAHHVQHLTGLGETVEYGALRGAAARQASIAYELQADCLAGVWLSTVLPPGTVSQGAMASAQQTAVLLHGGEGAVSADTHGTLPQRQAAAWTGYQSGRAGRCTSL